MVNLSKAELLIFPVCNESAFVLSANSDGSALTSKATSNLLNGDTYRCICAGIVSSIRQIEQGAPYIRKSLIYLTKKPLLKKAVVELIYKFDEKSYCECLKR